MSSEMVARAIGQQAVGQFAQQLVAQMLSMPWSWMRREMIRRKLGGLGYEF